MGGPDQGGPKPLASCLSLYQPQGEPGAPGLSHREDRAAHTQCIFSPASRPHLECPHASTAVPALDSGDKAGSTGGLSPALPSSSSAITLPCVGEPGWDRGVKGGGLEWGNLWAEGPADGVAGGAPRPAPPWAPSGRSWDIRLPAGHLAPTQELSQQPDPESGGPGVRGTHPYLCAESA